MELNGEYIDYGLGICELEEKFGKEINDGDYFTFWENCERILELKNCETVDDLLNKVISIWESLGDTQESRSKNLWYMD